MRRLLPIALSALSAFHVRGAAPQGTPACAPGCQTEVAALYTKFACANAVDVGCLCAKPDFFFGVRDCAGPACGATDVQVHDYLAGTFCLNHPPPFTPTSVQHTATPTTAGVTTQAPIASTTAPPSTSAESPASQPTTFETSSQTLTPSPQPTADSTSSVSTPTLTSGAETTGGSASETSTAAPASASSGLSQAAVIGIGVGVGAGVIAVAFVAICLLLKNRKRSPRQSVDATKHLSSSGREYPARDQGSFEKYSNDIEMVSHRYEDMVPRQKPRTMV